MGIIGIIANPASGKDVRRLVARASVFDNQEKRAIVRRALAGLRAADPGCRVAYLDDAHGIVRGALADSRDPLPSEPVAATRTGSALDTSSAAGAMHSLGCRLIITLGGDGTNRAVVKSWRHAPLIAISTGTNNVFPSLLEATVAGAAAGLISSGRVDPGPVAAQQKLIRVQVDGEADDIALIDAVLSTDRFVGARALLEPDQLRQVLLTRADPAAIGMTALGGLVHPLDAAEDAGLLVELGPGGERVNVPMAPGHYRAVAIARCRRVGLAQPVVMRGPGVLAFDGERERPLGAGQHARLDIARDGPWLIDVSLALRAAAHARHFQLDQDTHSVSS